MQTDSKQLLVWQSVLNNIKKNITKEQFKTWFSCLKIDTFSDKYIKIITPNLFVKECLSNNYINIITTAFNDICKIKPEIIFTCENNVKIKSKRDLTSIKKPRYNNLVSNINANFNFDNFIVGNCNRLAHAAAKSIIESPGYMYNPLFIYGSTGMGKTHLLQSIYLTLIKTNDNILYITCEDLTNNLINSLKCDKIDQFREKYREVDVLLIDDIHYLSNVDELKDEFFHTFNALYNAQKQIVLASDCHPEKIQSIEKRLISRFNWGLKCKLEPPDLETSAAIIEKKSLAMGINIPLDVIHLLARNITSNVREIEGAVLKIKKKSFLNNSEINVDLVKDTLYEQLSEKKNISVEMILRAISVQFELNITILLSKNRSKSVTLPRQMAMYLARKLTNLSYNEIGGFFGGRDHTTVMHAYDKIKNLKEENDMTKSVLIKVENELKRY